MKKETTAQILDMVAKTNKKHVYDLVGIAKGSLDNKTLSHKWSKAEVFYIDHLYKNGFETTKAPAAKIKRDSPKLSSMDFMARNKSKKLDYLFETEEKRDAFLKRHEDEEFELIDRKK